MTDASKLKIDTVVDREAEAVTLHLSGEIDVTADKAFAALSSEPPMPHAILDFAEVSRVNSMGLAQLMRLLEGWRAHTQKMEARNTNRMVSMLFKMTGMNRYFGADDSAGTGNAGATQAQRANPMKGAQGAGGADGTHGVNGHQPAAAVAQSGAGQQPQARMRRGHPRLRRIRRGAQPTQPAGNRQQAADPNASGKLTFSVSLQNNQQLSGWYFLNTLLQRRLEQPISISINQLGKPTTPGQFGMVFAKPFDACHLMAEHQYIPVVQPQDETDEVSIITKKADDAHEMTDFAGANVVTATEHSFVFLLGRFFCDECELDSSALNYRFTGNEITALRVLLNGEADMLFMLRKNYHQLSRISREATHLLEESETGVANHMLLLAPDYQHLREPLTKVMQALGQDAQGQQALNDLGIEGWSVPSEDELNMLLMLYKRYVG